ncbi:DNA polymerase [Gluconacetobacter diazotrophicus]|uniref:DNA polymerase n=1 Tax=Gluconacetobacter diazotrophicus TaxID=33996 RepID=UPI0011AABF4E|nr:DNA polymerase [Gluconacetobacter diazotrophicus]
MTVTIQSATAVVVPPASQCSMPRTPKISSPDRARTREDARELAAQGQEPQDSDRDGPHPKIVYKYAPPARVGSADRAYITWFRTLRAFAPDIPSRSVVAATFGEGAVVETMQIESDTAPRLYAAAFEVTNGGGAQRQGTASLVISVDTEYQQWGHENIALSYQVTAAHKSGRLIQFIVFPMPGERIPFGALPDFAMRLFGKHARCRETVLTIAHFNGAEWTMFADRDEFAPYLDGVRKSVVTLQEPFTATTHDPVSRNQRVFNCNFVDTFLISPADNGSLAAWGALLNHEKLELPSGAIENMKDFLRDNRQTFVDYAMRDTEVCLLALGYFINWCGRQSLSYRGFRAGITLGGTSVNLYKAFEGGSEALDILTGMEKRQIRTESGRCIWVKEPCDARVIHDPLAARCYHGGLNVAYTIGKVETPPDHAVYDIDLSGAYAGAMACLLSPSFKVSRATHVNEILEAVEVGQHVVARVKFQFPSDCEHPCLPISTKNGLIYVLKGESFCTGHEIITAVGLGAQIDIVDADIWHVTDRRLFARYIGFTVGERSRYAKKTLENLLFKEMTNSLYGKVAQGIKDRKISNFSAPEDGPRQLEPSAVTLPIIAAQITGIIRSALFELNALWRADGVRIVATTTDGSLVVAPVDYEFNAVATRSAAASRLQAGRDAAGITGDLLELKATGSALESYRTRANLIFDQDGECIAKAGASMKFETHNRNDIAAEMRRIAALDKIETRESRQLTSAFASRTGKAVDLISISVNKREHLDYDYKRRLGRDGETMPFTNIEEHDANREIVDRLHKQNVRATPDAVDLKTVGARMRRDSRNDVETAIVYRAIRRLAAKGVGGWRWDKTHEAFNVDRSVKAKDAKRPPIRLPGVAADAVFRVAAAQADTYEAATLMLEAAIPNAKTHLKNPEAVFAAVKAERCQCAEDRRIQINYT